MLPVLRFCGDGEVHTFREAIEALKTEFQVTEEESKELLPSGQQAIFDNRVGWARTYLKKAELLESPRRGQLMITQRGVSVLQSKPERINVAFLKQFDEFNVFQNKSHEQEECEAIEDESTVSEKTPEEALEVSYQQLRTALADEILEKVKECSPEFFERVVVELLVAMGYGGSRKDAGERVGKSGDGGIDGIIKEDHLGLDVIYIQAKRWNNTTVGSPEILHFIGALQCKGARKGVFITTSSYSKDAIETAAKPGFKVILIDGRQLAQMMIDFNVGVTKATVYEIKKMDMDYFSEE